MKSRFRFAGLYKFKKNNSVYYVVIKTFAKKEGTYYQKSILVQLLEKIISLAYMIRCDKQKFENKLLLQVVPIECSVFRITGGNQRRMRWILLNTDHLIDVRTHLVQMIYRQLYLHYYIIQSPHLCRHMCYKVSAVRRSGHLQVVGVSN